ncbi:hypothetical protein [Rhizobium sp. FY34]|uniref:hypothetical protein n=1 Tax=Rhizobium sp. FY34 TaxID=2562309 RepID=UPI0010C0C60B|nr:hypothetical protein [Rhizobium sp. FY34]
METAGASSRPSAGPTRKPSTILVSLVCGALLWGLAMGACMAAKLWLLGRLGTVHAPALFLLFAGGAAIAWVATAALSLLISRCLPRLLPRRAPLRAVLLALCLGFATVTITAGLFAVDYRAFYARWHADAFTRDWILQFLFTSASAVYQFLVLGFSLYLPLGPLLLVAATPILLRHTR